MTNGTKEQILWRHSEHLYKILQSGVFSTKGTKTQNCKEGEELLYATPPVQMGLVQMGPNRLFHPSHHLKKGLVSRVVGSTGFYWDF